MIQPIRVYPVGTQSIDSSPKGKQITLSPQMKRKLQPFPENGNLIHLNPLNTGANTPVIKRKQQKSKDFDQDNDITPTQLKTSSGEQDLIRTKVYLSTTINKLINLKSNIKNIKSESLSPSKKMISEKPNKYIFRTQPSQKEQQIRKFPQIQQGDVLALTKKAPTPNSGKSNIIIQEKSDIIKLFNNSQDERNRISKVIIQINNHQIERIFSKQKTDQKQYRLGDQYQKQFFQPKNERNDQSPTKSNKFFPERSPPLAGQEKSIQRQITSQLSHGRSMSNPIIQTKGAFEEEESGSNIVKFIVQNFIRSQAGMTYNKQYKINQDSIFCQQNFNGIKNRYYMGVCDGHGVSGHYVSQTIKKILPVNLESYMKLHVLKGINNELSPKDEPQILKAFLQSFSKTSKEIASCGIDVTFSGTTCVTVLIAGSHIWCANIGDSRAVIFFLRDGVWNIQPLSNDHKPDLPSEKKRILQYKGRVEPFYAPDGQAIGPPRVWLQNEQIPGLAMSRSFGDYVASTAGVISEPEVTYFKVEFQKGFIVVASDGVWEFLTNDKVCEFIQSIANDCSIVTNNTVEQIAQTLVKESIKQWQLEDDVIDDISCLVAHLYQN